MKPITSRAPQSPVAQRPTQVHYHVEPWEMIPDVPRNKQTKPLDVFDKRRAEEKTPRQYKHFPRPQMNEAGKQLQTFSKETLHTWTQQPHGNAAEEQERQIVKERLKTYPSTIKRGLDLSNLGQIQNLPGGIFVAGDALFQNCAKLKFLPQSFKVLGSLDLTGCASLVTLPDNLIVCGNLRLSHCSSLQAFPKGLKVEHSITASGILNIKEIPEDIYFGASFDISGCSNITTLPDRLMQLGPTTSNDCRWITISGTGISSQERMRLADLSADYVTLCYGD